VGGPTIEPPLDIPPLPPIILAGDIPSPDSPPPDGDNGGGGNDNGPGGNGGGGGSGDPGNTTGGNGNANPDQPLRVPEPSTILMFGSAMLAMAFLRRRKAAQEVVTVRAVRGRQA
jgi:hypothetical protein